MVLHLKDNGLKYIDALKGLRVVLVFILASDMLYML